MQEYELEELVGENIETEYGREAIVGKFNDGYQVIFLNKDNTTIYFPKVYGSFHEKAGEEIKILCSIV